MIYDHISLSWRYVINNSVTTFDLLIVCECFSSLSLLGYIPSRAKQFPDVNSTMNMKQETPPFCRPRASFCYSCCNAMNFTDNLLHKNNLM